MNTYLDTKVLDKMLFKIPKEEHEPDRVKEILKKHEEIRFVSFVGVDLGGHDTDAKIPVKLFLEDLEKFYESGVQIQDFHFKHIIVFNLDFVGTYLQQICL